MPEKYPFLLHGNKIGGFSHYMYYKKKKANAFEAAKEDFG